jgi:hypothetical protein
VLSRRVECGGGKLSNKKGGMNRTGASASSASINDSKKKEYPRNLREVKTKEELLSLIAWVKFVEDERKKMLEYKQRLSSQSDSNANNNIHKIALNDKNDQGFTYQNRENFKSIVRDNLNNFFKNIPTSTDKERSNLNFLINFIINNPHDGLGPYEDETYFEGIKDYVQEMKKKPEWRPKKSNENFENFLGNNSNLNNYDN